MDQPAVTDGNKGSTWHLVRDVSVFQVKLLIDGVRDLVLVPASLIAGFVSLIKTENGRPGRQFYEVVSLGQQSEHWINLFGALRNAPDGVDTKNRFGDTDVDDLIARVENFVTDEYRRGGVTAQARQRIADVLAAMRGGKKDE